MLLTSRSKTRGLYLLLLVVVIVVLLYVYVRSPPQHLHQQKLRAQQQPLHGKALDDTFLPGTSKKSKKADSEIILLKSRLVERASELNAQYGVVLFTMLNDAFVDFAHSWLCNTRSFERLHQRVVFLTTDLGTAEQLKAQWPETTVAVLNRSEFAGAMDYSTASYVRLMVERTRIIQDMLGAGVRLLLFELDAVWMKDPMPEVLSQQTHGDIVATKVTGRDVTAGGFLLLNPNPTTLKFWQEMTRLMDQLYDKIKSKPKSAAISEGENDQEFFTRLARTKYAGVKIAYLPAASFPDGKWYSLPEQQRRESRPFLINNNWILGTEAKRQRAKAFGHWFWEESQLKCNSSALGHLLL